MWLCLLSRQRANYKGVLDYVQCREPECACIAQLCIVFKQYLLIHSTQIITIQSMNYIRIDG